MRPRATDSIRTPAHRRTGVAAIVALLGALLAPLGVGTAATGATLGNGIDTIHTGFQIDGNKTASGATPTAFDWNDFLTGITAAGAYTFTPTGPYTTSDNFSSTGIIAGSFAWDNGTLADSCSKPEPTAFPGSVKPNDNPWPVGSANVIGKVNGCSVGTAYEVITDDDGVDHHILYQYWTRLEGNGDMTTYQVLEGGEVGRCDDYLIEFNYDPASGTTVTVLAWTGGCLATSTGSWTAVLPNFPHDAAVGVRVEGPGLPGEPETFGEVAVDLTAAGLFDQDSCTAFSATGYVTRTGNKVSSELGDLVGLGGDSVALSNCGAIEITKAADPDSATSDSEFGYEITRSGDDPVHDDTLVGTETVEPAAIVDGDASDASITGDIEIGETHRWAPVYAGDDYTLSESITAGDPWSTQSIVCTATDPATEDDVIVTVVDDGEPTGEEFPVYVGVTTECVITNATSYLTITKTTEGAEGELFDFDITGDDVSDVQLAGSADGTASDPIAYAPGTEVTIAELLDAANDAADDDLDWSLTSIVCSDGTTGDVSDGDVTVTTVAGETIDCVFTNEQLGRIIVNKVVAGTTTDATFHYSADWSTGTPALVDGGFDITTAQVDDDIVGSQTFLNVAPGSYTLSEDASTGFDTTDLVCVDPDSGTVVDDLEATIDLDPGETVSCTFTNTERGIILVDKETLPDEFDQDFGFEFGAEGETATPFTLNDATDDETSPWSSGLIVPGSYVLSELSVDDWNLTSISCGTVDDSSTTVVLEPGAVVTCTFTNTADLGSVSVTKSVAGVSDALDWSFGIDLVAPDASVASRTVDNTDLPTSATATWSDLAVGSTYTLLEDTLPAGWTAGEIQCTGVTDSDPETAGFQFLVTPGLVLSCTLTNTADPAEVELVKTVTGTGGDLPWSFDLTIAPTPEGGTAGRTASGSGDSSDTVAWTGLTPGVTYTLTETPTAGYTAGEITCTAGEASLPDADDETAGFQFVAAPGGTVSCALTNAADPIDLEIVKSTVGGDGTFEFVLTPLGEDGLPAGTPISESATTTAGSGTATFEGLAPGARFSLEESDAGDAWIEGDLVCTIPGSQAPIAIDPADFTVQPGSAISCAITNTATGGIQVVKLVEGDDGTFDFTGDWLDPTAFQITTDGGSGSTSFDNLPAGTYVLSEVPGTGYDGTKLECSNGDGSTIDGLTATIYLNPGELVTCTFTNAQWGTLVVDKVTVPEGSPESFDFEWAPLGEAAQAFALTDAADPFTPGLLPPGTYTVSETSDFLNWVLTDITCTDPADNDGEAGGVDDGTATVVVGLGETVTCTFTNAERGPLTFDKSVSSAPSDNGDGTWTIEYLLTVTSESNIPEAYDLSDELDFGAGIVPVLASVVSHDGITTNPGWNGVSDLLIQSGAEIPALGTHTYTVSVTAEVDALVVPEAVDCVVGDDEGTGFRNTGVVTFWGDGSDDDFACATLPVADLAVDKTGPFAFDLDTDGPAVDVTFTIVVTNLGPDTAVAAVLDDPLPAGVDFVSATGVDVTCGLVVNVVHCELGDLAIDEERTIEVTVSVPPTYDFAPIVNVATVATSTPESDLENNVDDHTTFVLPTLPLPPDIPTLAETGATLFAIQWAAGLLALGVAFLVVRRRRGAHRA